MLEVLRLVSQDVGKVCALFGAVLLAGYLLRVILRVIDLVSGPAPGLLPVVDCDCGGDRLHVGDSFYACEFCRRVWSWRGSPVGWECVQGGPER